MNLRSWALWAQLMVPAAKSGTVVLAYHLVGGATDSPVDLPASDFAAQLDFLAEHCDVVSLAQAVEGSSAANGHKPRVVLTFDDAYANFKQTAWPMLRERRLPSVLYVPVGFVRGSAPPPLSGAALPATTWDDVRELAADGVEIGSHSVEHVNLRRVSSARLERELTESRRILEAELGRAVTSFCYPQAKYDERVVLATSRHYETAVVAGGRRFTGGDLHRIPRFPVRRDERDFAGLLSAAFWLPEVIASETRKWRA